MSTNTPARRIHKQHVAALATTAQSQISPGQIHPGQRANLMTVQQQLLSLASDAKTLEEAGSGLAQIALELTNARRVVYFTPDSTAPTLISASRKDQQAQDTFSRQELVESSTKAIEARKLQVLRNKGDALLSVPVFISHQRIDVISASLSIGSNQIEPLVVSLQMVAAHATLWWQSQQKKQVDWEASMASGIVETVAEIEQSEGLAAASVIMTNRLRELTGAKQVALGLRENSATCMTLRAVSERAAIDRNSESGRLLENAMNEALLRNGPSIWPAQAREDRAGVLAHRKLVQQYQAEAAMTFPLTTSDDTIIGAVTFLSAGNADDSRLAAYGQTAAPFLAGALQTVQRLEGGRVKRFVSGLTKLSLSRSKQLIVAAILVMTVIVTPIEHKIDCPGQIQPSARRFAVAPYAGILEETLVKPGDIVTAEQLLATMDDREINWELSGLNADRDRAAKEYDIALSRNEAANMQMLRLEVERNDLKIKLLEHRKNTLNIRAAVPGVVLRGDLDEVQNAPVEAGQTLFEIAPLDQLRLEIRIPENDVTYVSPGMEVSVYLDALAKQQLSGTVTRIHPQAEVIDSQNVFIAEVELVKVPAVLRPGMHGDAKVIAARRALGWVYFHRPWQRLVNFLR